MHQRLVWRLHVGVIRLCNNIPLLQLCSYNFCIFLREHVYNPCKMTMLFLFYSSECFLNKNKWCGEHKGAIITQSKVKICVQNNQQYYAALNARKCSNQVDPDWLLKLIFFIIVLKVILMVLFPLCQYNIDVM